MPKLMPWRRTLLIVLVFMAALLAAGEAVSMIWLSGFPEWQPWLESLKIKFWCYAALSAFLMIIDVVLIARFIRLINQIDRIRNKETGFD